LLLFKTFKPLLLINVGQHISTISSNSTEKNLDVAISVPLQPTQL